LEETNLPTVKKLKTINEVLKYNDIYATNAIIQPLNKRYLHEVFAEFYIKKMHKSSDFKANTYQEKTRVRMTLDYLRAVATAEELLMLSRDSTKEEEYRLLSKLLQERFEKRLQTAESSYFEKKNNGKMLVNGVDTRVSDHW
jgi:AmiR/NasT family two-component response regulator